MISAELNAIKAIENQLNISLIKSSVGNGGVKHCYVNNEGHVINLNLCYCGITNLDCIIPHLKQLTKLDELSLENNESIRDVSPLVELKQLTYLSFSGGFLMIKDLSSLRVLKNLSLWLDGREIVFYQQETLKVFIGKHNSLKVINNIFFLVCRLKGEWYLSRKYLSSWQINLLKKTKG